MSNLLYGEPVSRFKWNWCRTLCCRTMNLTELKEFTKWAEDGNLYFCNVYDIRTDEPVEWAEPYVILKDELK